MSLRIGGEDGHSRPMATRQTKRANNPKRTTKPARAKSGVSADVVVKVDAKLKALYDRSVSAIDEATKRGMSAFDERWEAADAILSHDPPLYVVGGYKDAREFFREVMHEEERTGFRWVRVARYATPREEETYGPTLLDAAVSYMEAKYGVIEDSLPIAFDRLKIPVTRDGQERRLLLAECTVVDVTAAIRKLRRPKSSGRAAARDALLTALGKVSSLAGVQVRERAGLVSIANVPLAAWDRFCSLVRSVDITSFAAAAPTKSQKKASKKRATRAASGR